MEEVKQRKQDLEDEMSRFEQEISTNLPPPPGMPPGMPPGGPPVMPPVMPPGMSPGMPPASSHLQQQLPPPPAFPPNFRPPPLRGMPTFPGMASMHPGPMFGQQMHQMDGVPPGMTSMPSLPQMPQIPQMPQMGPMEGMRPLPQMPHGMPGMHPMMGMGPQAMMGSFPRPPHSAPSSVSQQMNTNMPVTTHQGPKIDPPTVPLGNYDAPSQFEEDTTSEINYMAEYAESEAATPSSATSNTGTDGASGAKDGGAGGKAKKGKKKVLRVAGGVVWDDETLLEWDVNDFRIFVGDLGNEVSDDALLRAFSAYPSLLRAKVIRDKKTKKTKGFGFVSFKDPKDYLRAMREMNGKYVGNRPIKLRKSSWKDRNINVARKKEKEKKKLGLR